MGGDYAPHATLAGAIEALPELEGELVLLGDEKILRPLLAKRRYQALADAMAQGASPHGCRVSLHPAAETIGMEDSIRAVRKKPNATINVGCQLAGESYAQKEPDHTPAAFVSAGHSGAVMASALLYMGRLPGVERPAISVKLPTISEHGCVILDVGANVDCKPEHLRDFAVMGALFAQAERDSSVLPKVALLSNGEERSKGNEQTRAAMELIERLPCFQPGPDAVGIFQGYAEGKEIFKGEVDVVVTDGFVGNVVLKSVEGLGSAVVTLLKEQSKHNWFTPIGLLLASGALRSLKRKLDYAETGAAPLLGVSGYVLICHGRSNPTAIKNALLRAQSSLRSRIVERMEAALRSTEKPQGLSSSKTR